MGLMSLTPLRSGIFGVRCFSVGRQAPDLRRSPEAGPVLSNVPRCRVRPLPCSMDSLTSDSVWVGADVDHFVTIRRESIQLMQK
ncbi:hypothetical protein J2853_005528 [Streptosporangium lutulentum]|uniref:Uncharacterized protein n=1 Tax=Streptosporangium lutulentum TaxID=1461250 RepID=A0ABT9QHS8_9ACTN|nr:hypothetical protein [Streptosporangium lutulentum]